MISPERVGVETTLNKVSARTLNLEQQERVRAELRKLYSELGTQEAVAAALEIKQPSVGAILNGVRPPGMGLAAKIAAYRGVPVDALLTGQASYKDLPGWDVAVKDALARRLVPRWAVEKVGTWTAQFTPARVDAALVKDLALLWLSHADPAEVVALDTAEADEDRAKRDMSKG